MKRLILAIVLVLIIIVALFCRSNKSVLDQKDLLLKDAIEMCQTYREIMVQQGIAEWQIVDLKTGKTSFTLTLKK